ncbi:MFS transporter [Gandjariella thermophila]|uniref:MFS transporter n=1 Tax=Gandjariella thermophila TaxID=1931992 RepID=A0A4D4JCW8_9PSEU|nr:MFS transporter [Gandjariella thermophila]GDY32850.1 MFS transporter [Gandjariella thermophila]
MTSASPDPVPHRTVQSWHVLCGWLLLGWTVSAADRTITGPVVTWMIGHHVSFLRDAPMPYALGGLIGGLFFAGYMLTQFPGGYLGDRFGHRTIIGVSLLWAGIATLLNGVISGLAVFIVLRVLTGLGEGAFYSNDRTLITARVPVHRRSFAMGLVITGLAIGITLATLLAPWMINLGSVLGTEHAWRMPFLLQGAVTLVVAGGAVWYFRRDQRGLPYGRATLALLRYAAVCLAAVMAVYYLGVWLGASQLGIAGMEILLALGLVLFVFRSKRGEIGPVLRNRSLVMINISYIAVLWNLWFFSFWSVAIVAGAAHSSFLQAALIAAFNAGAGILGFPVGGWLSDLGVRRGWGRKGMLVSFTFAQGVLTVVFGLYLLLTGKPSVVVMGLLLFAASLFFNALQPIGHALIAELATEPMRGSAFGMNNLIGEMGAVLAPAVGGYLRDVTGSWTQAVLLDAALIFVGFAVLCFVRERRDAASPVGTPEASGSAVTPAS